MSAFIRARGYLAKLPPAVAGQGGHKAAFQAACRLVEFGLSWEEAWELFQEWNERCLPPWSERDLHHKLADAFRRTQPRGEFLQRNRDLRGRPGPRVLPAKPEHFRPPPELASKFPNIPPTTAGTVQEREHLAKIRGLNPEAVSRAVELGLIRFGVFRGKPAWFALDKSRRIAQARRLDGFPWATGVKAWTLRNSQARWPVGASSIIPGAVVALVEGGPDILAVLHMGILAGRQDISPVAMLGGQARIHPDASSFFRGRIIVLFPHSDSAGQSTLTRWLEDIGPAGPAAVKVVDFRSFPGGNGIPKDLNELARFASRIQAESLFPING